MGYRWRPRMSHGYSTHTITFPCSGWNLGSQFSFDQRSLYLNGAWPLPSRDRAEENAALSSPVLEKGSPSLRLWHSCWADRLKFRSRALNTGNLCVIFNPRKAVFKNIRTDRRGRMEA